MRFFPKTRFFNLKTVFWSNLESCFFVCYSCNRSISGLDTENGGAKYDDFDVLFNGERADDYLLELMDENESDYDDLAEYLACSGNKIGGYAEFIQSDHRSRDENGHLEFQLLQMDDEYVEFEDYPMYIFLFLIRIYAT